MKPLLALTLLGCAMSHTPAQDAACTTHLVVSEREGICVNERAACPPHHVHVCVTREPTVTRCGETCWIDGPVIVQPFSPDDGCHDGSRCPRGTTSRCVAEGCIDG